MNYRILIFRDGQMVARDEANAKSHKQALGKALGKWWSKFTHVTVIGNTVRRYNFKRKLIKGDEKFYRTQVGIYPSILIMVGNVSELRRFKSIEEREKVFACTNSTFAESAESAPEPTDTTVLSNETSDSKSGLMSKKISNGSATNVTWQGLLTRYSIEESFGADNVVDLDEPEWIDGSRRSRSKSKKQTLLATVKQVLHLYRREPSSNPEMEAMAGKTIKVTKDIGDKYWYGEGCYWKDEWLDFTKAIAKVHFNGRESRYLSTPPDHMNGEILYLKPCEGSEPVHYTEGKYCFDVMHLYPAEVSRKYVAKVKDIEVWSSVDGTKFVSYMQKFIGKTLDFKKSTKSHMYSYRGWMFHDSWLEFEGKTNKLGKEIMSKYLHTYQT